jgi:fumarate hydratase class II
MAEYRIEKDAMGEVRVPADRLWGAQTQRSIENFPIGVPRFRWERPVIRALGLVKLAPPARTRSSGASADKAAIERAARGSSTARSTPSSRWLCSRPGRARSRT